LFYRLQNYELFFNVQRKMGQKLEAHLKNPMDTGGLQLLTERRKTPYCRFANKLIPLQKQGALTALTARNSTASYENI